MWPVVSSRTCRSGPLARAAMVAALAGCGDRAARVQLVPLGGDCGRPADANEVRVTAYGPSGSRAESIGLDESVAFGSFPADTEQFAVEVFGGGGVLAAEGKSAPLAFHALPDGGAIYVLMAPPDGFCELPPMSEARSQPLVAAAGNGALVVGGIGPSGPLATAEYYDPTAAAFAPVDVPQALADQGFAGAALATLPDGRVALTGGPGSVFIVFDPDRRAFVTDPTVIDRRAFHAAIATGDQEVLLAGGCTGVTLQQCGDLPKLQTERYRLDMLRAPEPSAVLAAGYRTGAQLFDLGVQLDGARRFLLAGGLAAARLGGGAEVGRTDRFALDDAPDQVVMGGHAQPVALDGGAVLTAFAEDGASPDGAASVIAPDAAAARDIPGAPNLTGVRLIGLEDGRVLGFGGGADLMGDVVSYDPTHGAWRTAEPARTGAMTGSLRAPSLARLADGSVLVVGGAMSPRAWLYRPSLVGPTSPSVTVAPAGNIAGGVLTAPDPATVTRAPAWQLTAPAGGAMARALVGGPRMAVGAVIADVHVVAGGVALIARQTGPGEALVARLAPGSPAELVQLAGGAERVVCSASAAVAPFDPAAQVRLRLTLTDHDARLTRGGDALLTCSLPAGDRGAWGVATLGDGAQVTVDVVTVARESPAT
jgi:hypothetical protein